jgi:hypothetical protein
LPEEPSGICICHFYFSEMAIQIMLFSGDIYHGESMHLKADNFLLLKVALIDSFKNS